MDNERGVVWVARNDLISSYSASANGIEQLQPEIDSSAPIIALDTDLNTGMLWALSRASLHYYDHNGILLGERNLDESDEGTTLAWDPALQ
ncbi:MAG: hypothetical protein K0A95_10690 [Chromatiales bacterium]|nr:hypothetical protein [Gammaproteobacteria bacterium]MBW6477526.1 hypothetical protein [Chromatiales bacterium]